MYRIATEIIARCRGFAVEPLRVLSTLDSHDAIVDQGQLAQTSSPYRRTMCRRLLLKDAMDRERNSALAVTNTAFKHDGSAKPPEFLSQLALKRGAQRRGAAGPDLSSAVVQANLLSQKPDLRYFHLNDPAELAERLHWYDELEGCAAVENGSAIFNAHLNNPALATSRSWCLWNILIFFLPGTGRSIQA
jgi:hypothetical protein